MTAAWASFFLFFFSFFSAQSSLLVLCTNRVRGSKRTAGFHSDCLNVTENFISCFSLFSPPFHNFLFLLRKVMCKLWMWLIFDVQKLHICKSPPPPLYIRYLNTELLSWCFALGESKRVKSERGGMREVNVSVWIVMCMVRKPAVLPIYCAVFTIICFFMFVTFFYFVHCVPQLFPVVL